MENLLKEIRGCTLCKDHLPMGPRPVLSATKKSKILIVGQAPGIRVHNTGIPWNDPSGKQLRKWLNVTDEQFYNPEIFGIVPMGFCYPGTGKSGDLPPRKECAQTWHQPLLKEMTEVKLTLLIGAYAQKEYLVDRKKSTLTQNVQDFEQFMPKFLPLPHPSPRNRMWLKKNPWFEDSVIPVLQGVVSEFL